jgi:hypothetical protein
MPTSPPPPSPRPAFPLLDPGASPPLLTPRQRRLVVRKVFTTAQVGLTADPRALAIRMGFAVVPYFPEHGEGHPGLHLVAYPAGTDPRERGWCVHQDLARVLLAQERAPHNASDILLVAFDLAVPVELVVTSLDWLIQEQQHCPEGILCRILAARNAHSPIS